MTKYVRVTSLLFAGLFAGFLTAVLVLAFAAPAPTRSRKQQTPFSGC
jgi:hypothetical protein